MKVSNEHLHIHFAYWIIILVLFIIAIATDRWTAQQKFTEYLSNAATMTSLVLGLVAIFYSFIANDGLSRSLGNINSVSSEIKEAKEKIAAYVELTNAAGATARDSAEQMQRVSQQVDSNLISLSGTLTAIRSQTDRLDDAFAALPVRLDKLESNVLDATKSLGEKAAPPAAAADAKLMDASIVKRFLELSPLSANLVAYACVLAFKNDKTVSLPDFCTAIKENIPSYLSGYTACMDAAQLIDRRLVPAQSRVFTLESVHPTLVEASRDYFVRYVERTYKDKPEVRDSWLAKLASVEALFA
jgi:hypothetical protein